MSDALDGLLDVYTATTFIAKHLGEPDLAALAAMHARAVAAELSAPARIALAELLRAHAVSSPARERSMALAARAADRVAPWVGSDPGAAEMYGMLHLTCALTLLRCGGRLSRPSIRLRLPTWPCESAPVPTSVTRVSAWPTTGSGGSIWPSSAMRRQGLGAGP